MSSVLFSLFIKQALTGKKGDDDDDDDGGEGPSNPDRMKSSHADEGDEDASMT